VPLLDRDDLPTSPSLRQIVLPPATSGAPTGHFLTPPPLLSQTSMSTIRSMSADDTKSQRGSTSVRLASVMSYKAQAQKADDILGTRGIPCVVKWESLWHEHALQARSSYRRLSSTHYRISSTTYLRTYRACSRKASSEIPKSTLRHLYHLPRTVTRGRYSRSSSSLAGANSWVYYVSMHIKHGICCLLAASGATPTR
jgi:hypothetical protein